MKDDNVNHANIFVSYSHLDEKWHDMLVPYLLAFRGANIEPWCDKQIEIGEDWRESIFQAMNDARLAILMITPNFLASDFIRNEELPHLLDLNHEKLLDILPVHICWSPLDQHEKLRSLQCLWDDKPLCAYEDRYQGEMLLQLAARVHAKAGVDEASAPSNEATLPRLSKGEEEFLSQLLKFVADESRLPRLEDLHLRGIASKDASELTALVAKKLIWQSEYAVGFTPESRHLWPPLALREFNYALAAMLGANHVSTHLMVSNTRLIAPFETCFNCHVKVPIVTDLADSKNARWTTLFFNLFKVQRAAVVAKTGDEIRDLSDPPKPRDKSDVTGEVLEAFLGMRLEVDDQVIGVIKVENRRDGGPRFGESDKTMLKYLVQRREGLLRNALTWAKAQYAPNQKVEEFGPRSDVYPLC